MKLVSLAAEIGAFVLLVAAASTIGPAAAAVVGAVALFYVAYRVDEGRAPRLPRRGDRARGGDLR